MNKKWIKNWISFVIGGSLLGISAYWLIPNKPSTSDDDMLVPLLGLAIGIAVLVFSFPRMKTALKNHRT